MIGHKIAVISLAAIVGFGTLTLVSGCHSNQTAAMKPASAGRKIDGLRPAGPAQMYGKVRPPAEVFVGLLGGERATDPLTLGVAVASDVPVASGVITLTMSAEDAVPAEKLGLWPITSPGILDELTEYAVGPLAPGRYRFTAILEFTPDQDEAPMMAVSSCLYLDVQADIIDATNVSFAHLKRLQLQREIEERALADYRPMLATADRATKTREIAILKARDPDFGARRIEELNQVPAQTETGTDPAEMGQVTTESTVPSRLFDSQ